MELGDEFWNLHSAAGSKRPSPSPGAEERENKKIRTEPYDAMPGDQVVEDGTSFQLPEHLPVPSEDPTNTDLIPFDDLFENYPGPIAVQLQNDPGDWLPDFPSGWPEFWQFDEMQMGTDEMMVNDAISYMPAAEQQQLTGNMEVDVQFDQRFQGLPLDDHTWTRNLPYLTPDGVGLLSGLTSVPENNNIGMIQVDESVPSRFPSDEANIRRSPELPPVEREKEDCNDYDTCFGVVKATPTSSIKPENGSHSIPVMLRPYEDFFLLHDLSSNRHAGILREPCLLKVLLQSSLHLDATLWISETNSAKESNKPFPKKLARVNHTPNYSLRIAIYGLLKDRDLIGGRFSDAGLFLQHPFADEIKPGIEYDNPQYLRRPGAEMPKLERLSLESMQEDSSHDILDNELGKSRWLRIFDDANADGDTMNAVNPLISDRLCGSLLSHQITALAMLQEKECGYVERPKFPALWQAEHDKKTQIIQFRHQITKSIERRPIPAMGGILADDMGLGKTLSVLALICASLDLENLEGNGKNSGKYSGTLIVAPKSTLYGWEAQILHYILARRHIRPGRIQSIIYHGQNREALADTFGDKDIVITTYETLRSEWSASEGGRPLLSWKWLRVVLDEAHHIRNRASQTFQSVCDLTSRFRWCLTGTPIHNSLDDYGALLSFIRVYPFERKAQFVSWIVKPLETGTNNEFNIDRLQRLIRATCLRRLKRNCPLPTDFQLPPRFEETKEIRLNEVDQILYDEIKEFAKKAAAGLDEQSRGRDAPHSKQMNMLPFINALRLICDHGKELLPHYVESIISKGFVPQSSPNTRQPYGGKCIGCQGELDETILDLDGPNSICTNCLNSEEPSSSTTKRHTVDSKDQVLSRMQGRYGKLGLGDSSHQPSAKVLALLENLKSEKMTGGKSRKGVIFSCWTKMLDLVQHALQQEGLEFQRIDGKTSLQGRRDAMREFSDNPDCTAMLASIGSAAEGLNLIAASVVHLLEPHWNPMVEAQAVDRVYA
ncbi:hypothetical protein G7054_g10485 [Neopestalotiopsis clavispora]|nr:hypothetical protein G7054_g10485 [Neopestalotiopsis clavispora]